MTDRATETRTEQASWSLVDKTDRDAVMNHAARFCHAVYECYEDDELAALSLSDIVGSINYRLDDDVFAYLTHPTN